MKRTYDPTKVYNYAFADRERAANNGSFGFRSYTDTVGAFGTVGKAIIFDDGTKDNRGNPLGRHFVLNQSHYNIQAREGQKDATGMLLTKFLDNAPFTAGSPNGEYREDPDTGERVQVGVMLKLIDTASDAKLKIETQMRRANAQVSAGSIDPKTLSEVAANIGVFGEPDELMRSHVIDFASKQPASYFEILESNERGYRALIRKAISDGIFTLQGEIIKWGETLIGTSEDNAVKKLLDDKDVLSALQEHIQLGTKLRAKSGPKSKK